MRNSRLNRPTKNLLSIERIGFDDHLFCLTVGDKDAVFEFYPGEEAQFRDLRAQIRLAFHGLTQGLTGSPWGGPGLTNMD